jgi:hypothetical protein
MPVSPHLKPFLIMAEKTCRFMSSRPSSISSGSTIEGVECDGWRWELIRGREEAHVSATVLAVERSS